MPLPVPQSDSDKEARGTAVVVGGSVSVPGAMLLSGMGALRAGAGKLQLVVPKTLVAGVGIAFPEAGIYGFAQTSRGEPAARAWRQVREFVEHADAVLIGPGFMDENAAGKLTRAVLENAPGPAFVLDAMALTGLAEEHEVLATHRGRIVLTPHAGEMAKLAHCTKEQVMTHPLATARAVADELKCVVVMKGATTYIVAPDGPAYRHRGGVVGLATAGSGDVLAGVITGLIARGIDTVLACIWGVYAHGKAGERLSEAVGALGFMAREIPPLIPGILCGR